MNTITAKLRARGRALYDSLYCQSFPDKQTLGDIDQWTIRTGGLNCESIIYSGGVGLGISFELKLVKTFGCQVFAFDPSPVGVATMHSLSGEPEMANIHFMPVGLAGKAGAVPYAIGGDHDGLESFKSGEDRTMTCETIEHFMRSHGHRRIDLLKLDIEGFEYEVLEHCIEKRIDIRQICVEFHHFLPGIPRSRTSAALARLKKSGFSTIHKHRCEFTLYRNTR